MSYFIHKGPGIDAEEHKAGSSDSGHTHGGQRNAAGDLDQSRTLKPGSNPPGIDTREGGPGGGGVRGIEGGGERRGRERREGSTELVSHSLAFCNLSLPCRKRKREQQLGRRGGLRAPGSGLTGAPPAPHPAPALQTKRKLSSQLGPQLYRTTTRPSPAAEARHTTTSACLSQKEPRGCSSNFSKWEWALPSVPVPALLSRCSPASLLHPRHRHPQWLAGLALPALLHHHHHPFHRHSREPSRSEHPSTGRDRSAERRPGDKYVDVMDLGGVRTDIGPDRKDSRKDDKYYSRHSSKDPHSAPASSARHFGRADRVSGDKYEGEGRGGRDDYRAGKDDYRAGKDVGRSRDYDSRSGRDERGHRYGGNGYQDNGRESGYRGGERREEGRQGRGNDRTAVEEGGKYGSKRDDYRDNKIFSRKEKFSDKRFHEKEDAKQERGDWRESNGTRRPEQEKGKRLEKSMKDIVDSERLMKDDLDYYLGEGRGNDRNRSGRFRGRDDFDSGKERVSRDAGQTQRVSFAEKHGSKETNLKSTEKGASEQKSGGFTKLKLKVGGVTHTIVSDSAKRADGAAASGANKSRDPESGANKTREPESGGANKRRRQRLILQDQSDDDEFDLPPPKAARKTDSFSPGHAVQGEQKARNGEGVNSVKRSEHQKTMTLGAGSSLQAVRKSSRVPKRRVLDGDEDDVEPQRPSASSKGGHIVEDEEDKEEGDAEEESSEDAGQTVADESFEGLGDEDIEEGPETVKPGKVQQSRPMKEIAGSGVTLTARQRAMQTSKDVDRESAPPLIEYPEGLTNPLSRKGKNNLSEAERQVKRLEAAHRRKQQVEKTARDIQATAIQRILGQDSTRKRRENRLEKQRQDIEEEKKAAELAPSTNSIRWILGPSGSIVSFSEDVGLPSFFDSGPIRYPPPREKCAAPTCSNSYKYRDSKSKVPLCSLECYKALHTALPITSIH